MSNNTISIYNRIINAGVGSHLSIEKRYRLIYINKFCFFTVLLALAYCVLFYFLSIYPPLFITMMSCIGFAGVIYLNNEYKFLASKFLLILVSASSVLFISITLGFQSGFHLYLYTAPLFVFWLFHSDEIKYIYLSFLIYLIDYSLVFLVKKANYQLYFLDDANWVADLYSINMIFNLILVFILFYNYSNYYNILLNNLLDKQTQLQNEITKRKESESNTKKLFDDLSVSFKNLEQFGFVVSHNMRAPLANIKGFVSLFDRSNDSNREENVKMIEYIENSAEHLDGILTDLNAILKNKTGVLETKEVINLNYFIDIITKSMFKEISNTNAVIVKTFSEDSSIYTIKSVLKSILYNLLQNAIKYRKSMESPRIEIEFYTLNNDCIVKISDNGVGIDLKKYHDRIFKLYSRFQQNVEGKGIGLYLVKNQVELLGGTIEVESEINKGTIFTINLPKTNINNG